MEQERDGIRNGEVIKRGEEMRVSGEGRRRLGQERDRMRKGEVIKRGEEMRGSGEGRRCRNQRVAEEGMGIEYQERRAEGGGGIRREEQGRVGKGMASNLVKVKGKTILDLL